MTLLSRFLSASPPVMIMAVTALLALVTIKLFLLGQIPGLSLPGSAMTTGHFSGALLALSITLLTCGLAWRLSKDINPDDARSAVHWLTAAGVLLGGALYTGVVQVLFDPGERATPLQLQLDILLNVALTAIGTVGMMALTIGFLMAWSVGKAQE